MPPDITLPLLLTAVLPVFLLMGTGGLLRRLGILTPEGDSAFVALAVAMSNVSLLGISAPFWALVAGVIVSALVEAGSFGEKQAA